MNVTPGPRRAHRAENLTITPEAPEPINLDDYIDPASEQARERGQERQSRATLLELEVGQVTAGKACERADAKATALLGLFGAALAAALVLATRPAGGFSTVVLVLATLPLLGAVGALLSVLYARLDGDHGFPRWATYRRNLPALIDHLTLPSACRIHSHALRLADLSALAVAKYRRVNLAVALLLAGLPLLALAALTA